MQNNDDGYQKLEGVLRQIVKQNRPLQKGLDKVNVEEVWNSEMGPGVKGYTTGIQLRNNTLYVQLSSSVLREELSYGKSKIVRLLNEALGKELIKELVLR